MTAEAVRVRPTARIPRVVIPVDAWDAIATVGVPDMTFDGGPFPFATIGTWRLEFNEGGAAELTISIPILIVAPEARA